MHHSSTLAELLADIKTSVNMIWFAMIAALLILAGIAYALPLLGLQPVTPHGFSKIRGWLEVGGFMLFLAAIYLRIKHCSRDYLLRKLKKLPLTPSGLSHRLNHHDYRLRLSPHSVRRFNNISTAEQRIFFLYSIYFKNLVYSLSLVQVYALVGFTISALTADFSVVLPYIGVSSAFSVLFLLPTTVTPEATVTKARATGLITNI